MLAVYVLRSDGRPAYDRARSVRTSAGEPVDITLGWATRRSAGFRGSTASVWTYKGAVEVTVVLEIFGTHTTPKQQVITLAKTVTAQV